MKKNYKLCVPEESSETNIESVNLLRHLEKNLRKTFSKYNFEETMPSTFEYLDIYRELIQDFNEDQLYKLIGDDGKVIALRWDYTIPIARYYCSYQQELEARYSYFGKVYRKTSRYSGSNQEEYQAGIELINCDSNETEMIFKIFKDSLDALNLDNVIIEIGSAKIYKRICELTNNDKALINIISNKNISAMKEYLQTQNYNQELTELLMQLPRLYGDINMINSIKINDEVIYEEIQKLKTISKKLNNVAFDIAMCPKMQYYTGIIFNVYAPNVSKPIICGGRYDSLFKKLGIDATAIGMAYYLDYIVKAKLGGKNYD